MAFEHDTWIKLYRNITQWEWYTNPITFKLYIHCLVKAQNETVKWRGVDVPRGTLVTSVERLSNETGMSVRSVRTALRNLKSTNDVTIKTTNRFTLISVHNFDKRQNKKTKTDKPSVTQTPTCKDNNIINNIIKDSYGEFQNVHLTTSEYSNLSESYKTSERLNKGIEVLSCYLASKGDKYKSHYAVLGKHSWVFQKVDKEIPLQNAKKGGYNAFV